jgi:hypothetical protein
MEFLDLSLDMESGTNIPLSPAERLMQDLQARSRRDPSLDMESSTNIPLSPAESRLKDMQARIDRLSTGRRMMSMGNFEEVATKEASTEERTRARAPTRTEMPNQRTAQKGPNEASFSLYDKTGEYQIMFHVHDCKS